MKTVLQLVAILLAVCAPGYSQAAPAATGPAGLPVGGDLHYSVRYSESEDFGGLGDWQSSGVSASASYTNVNRRLPFSLAYGGGYSWTTGSTSYGSGLNQSLMLSQGIVGRHWSLTASDSVGYWQQAPTTGFSGVAGSGEPIGGSGPDTPPTQTILTLNTQSVNNLAAGSFAYTLDRATSLSFGGSSNLLRYPGGNGLDTDGMGANAGINRRLSARDSVSGQYMYFRFGYPESDFSGTPGISFSSEVNSVSFSYRRIWNRWLTTSASAGPEWIQSSYSTVLPASTSVSASASAQSRLRFGAASLTYFHGISGGAGYLPGAESDSISANFSREFRKKVSIGVSAAYMRTAGLNANGVTDGRYAGVQAMRGLGRYLSVNASYTAIDQSSSSALPVNVLSQTYQVLSAGIGYTPRPTHLKH